jgi:hypothetical protein
MLSNLPSSTTSLEIASLRKNKFANFGACRSKGWEGQYRHIDRGERRSIPEPPWSRVVAAIALVKARGYVAGQPILQELLAESEYAFKKEARAARLVLLSQYDPTGAVQELTKEEQELSSAVVDNILSQAGNITPQTLIDAIDGATKDMRSVAARALAHKGCIDSALAARMTSHEDIGVRLVGYRWLVDQGAVLDESELSEKLKGPQRTLLGGLLAGGPYFETLFNRPYPDEAVDDLLVQMYRHVPVEDLQKKIDWVSVHAPLAVRALGLFHFDKFSQWVRANLDNEFDGLRTEWNERHAATLGSAAESLIKKTEDLRQFLQSRFIANALIALADNGDHTDIERARKYVRSANSDAARAALKLLRRYGDASDVPLLIEVSSGATWNTTKLASAIVALAPDLRALIDSVAGNNALLGAILREIPSASFSVLKDLIERLLYNDNMAVRNTSLALLVQNCTSEYLESILDSYLEAKTYYYNVPFWIDRILCAPSFLREVYKKQLVRA